MLDRRLAGLCVIGALVVSACNLTSEAGPTLKEGSTVTAESCSLPPSSIVAQTQCV